MGILSLLGLRKEAHFAQAEPRGMPLADLNDSWAGFDFADPALAEWLRGVPGSTDAHNPADADRALLNTTVFRSVSLIASTIAALPLYLRRRNKATGEVTNATDHPLYELLLNEPNDFQSSYDFKSIMQANALIQGNGYAVIVWSRGRPIRLVPLDPYRVTVMQNDDWTLTYRYRKKDGSYVDYPSDEILHIKGLSRDGIVGLSRVHMAREAIALAQQTQHAAARLFSNGIIAGLVFSHPKTLTKGALERLRESITQRYSGAENAHKPMILEEGMEPKSISNAATAQNSQQIENRRLQIEEIARVFDIPRPLLMLDETSWGSGVEQLGIFFVRYGLAPWFVSWEQSIRRAGLTRRERREDELFADFDERELLRGSLKDQADYYAKALGAGGHSPWMKQNEVRNDVGLGSDPNGNSLTNPMTQPAGQPPAGTEDGENNGRS